MGKSKGGRRNQQGKKKKKPFAKGQARKQGAGADSAGASARAGAGPREGAADRWAAGPHQKSKWGLHKNILKAAAAAAADGETGAASSTTPAARAPADGSKKGRRRSRKAGSSGPKQPPAATAAAATTGGSATGRPAPPPPARAGAGKLTKLQAMMQSKMDSAKFRWLNEKLYSTTSDNAFAFYKKAPENWQVYHHGYRSQVKSWPTNPLNIIADVLRKHPRWVVGDFGCGDAELSRLLPKNTVHSFDLVAANDSVVACDMKRVPLKAGTLDAAVYCLSLMGTNVKDFLVEARRTLREGGMLIVAEVASRINGGGVDRRGAAGGDGYAQFVQQLGLLGFDLRSKDLSNSVFSVFQFTRTKRQPDTVRFTWSFDPWVYKKR